MPVSWVTVNSLSSSCSIQNPGGPFVLRVCQRYSLNVVSLLFVVDFTLEHSGLVVYFNWVWRICLHPCGRQQDPWTYLRQSGVLSEGWHQGKFLTVIDVCSVSCVMLNRSAAPRQDGKGWKGWIFHCQVPRQRWQIRDWLVLSARWVVASLIFQ